MPAETILQPISAEEFFILPDPESGGKMELDCGRVITQMPTSGTHAKLASRIDRRLGTFVEQHKLGETLVEAGFLLGRDPDIVRAPDVAFLSREDTPEGGIAEEGFIPTRPSLAIEVISPGDLDSEVAGKLEQYFRAGVPIVWLVRPKTKSVTVSRSDRTSKTLKTGALTSEDAGLKASGFELPLASLFA